MQPLYLAKVVGKAFVVKFDGQIMPITHDMTLTFGDVFSVSEGKNAWFVLRSGEQIDILDKSYIVTTQGNIELDASAELAYIDNDTGELRVQTQELVKQGLTNQQATALILTRYDDYFSTLQTSDESQLTFAPQVYRITENQQMQIHIDELSAFIQGNKSDHFNIKSIFFDEKESDIHYDAKHFTIKPKVAFNSEINIKIDITIGAQTVSADLTFVVQPATATLNVSSYKLDVNKVAENDVVANIVTENFDEKTLKYSILNDPNHYFFTIENHQVCLTKEGVNAIANKTLALDAMEVTIQAKDHNHTKEATIEVPIIESSPSATAPNELVASTEPTTSIEPEASAELEKSDEPKVSDESAAGAEPEKEEESVVILEGFSADITQYSQPKNKERLSITKSVAVTSALDKKDIDKNDENEIFHFQLNLHTVEPEHIVNFILEQDRINLTAILNLTETQNINKHLYIENDNSGSMALHISLAGDGEINRKFIFDGLNINKIADLYHIEINELSHEKISHLIVDSMVENTKLIIHDL